MHFHCPKCGPLKIGATRAICGATITQTVVPRGEPMPTSRKCPACKSARREHDKTYH